MKTNKDNFLALLFLFVFSPIFGVKIAITIKVWMILCLLFLMMSFKEIKFKISLIYLLPMYFFSFGLFSLFVNMINITFISLFFSIIPFVLLLLTLTLEQFSRRNIEESFLLFVKFYLSISLFYGMYGLYYISGNMVENNQVYYGVFIQHLIPRFSGLVGDPNICAFYFSVIFCIAYVLKYSYTLLLTLLFIVFLTGSRTGLLFIFVALLFLVIKKTKFSLLFVLFFTLSVYSFFDFDLNELGLDQIFRINDNVDISKVGGRMKIWKPAILYIIDNPLSMAGFGSVRTFSQSILGTPTYFHNSYIEIAYEFGLIGLAIFILIFLIFLIKSSLFLDEKIIFFFVLTIYSLSLSIHLNEVFLLATTFIVKKYPMRVFKHNSSV